MLNHTFPLNGPTQSWYEKGMCIPSLGWRLFCYRMWRIFLLHHVHCYVYAGLSKRFNAKNCTSATMDATHDPPRQKALGMNHHHQISAATGLAQYLSYSGWNFCDVFLHLSLLQHSEPIVVINTTAGISMISSSISLSVHHTREYRIK